MIYWEARSNEMRVVCSACGSGDTRVSFEFLCYTRHTCRACSTTFTHSGGRVQRQGREDDALADDGGRHIDASPGALKNPDPAVSAQSALALAIFRVPPRAVNREVRAT
jgi:hypothetical protein